jgi:hypothetical protein
MGNILPSQDEDIGKCKKNPALQKNLSQRERKLTLKTGKDAISEEDLH